ncbi:TetR family transcriptional regulator [Pseudonocardia endophytica]|uniref:TetR family transcriptional regulator n=2 Tax=Pseudonocardia endophytica TaxID=401976 RepID=A0A4R1I6J7_PSEEN|nr:TetR family transcriptional regulator [Pseudonocardia endophytica]
MDATRGALARATVHLFLTRGVAATTADDIAAAAGVSRRTFFRYFASKEDAFTEPLLHQADEFAPLLRDRPRHEPLVAGLRAVVERIATTYASMDQVLPLYRAVREDPGLVPSIALFNARLREVIAAWAADRLGSEPGDLEPQLFAETAVAVRETVLRLWANAPAGTDVGALTDAAFDHWSSGFAALGGSHTGNC